MTTSIQGSSNIIKIAITGPESTGKSTLTKALASHYNTVCVDEYAREYINGLTGPYEESDLLAIARKQAEMEKDMLKAANKVLFCDTDLLVVKIWSAYKYGRVAAGILELSRTIRYDFRLLMDVDLPWQYDPQREHPDKRKFFFDWFQRELDNDNAAYSIVSGSLADRTGNAIRAIDDFLEVQL